MPRSKTRHREVRSLRRLRESALGALGCGVGGIWELYTRSGRRGVVGGGRAITPRTATGRSRNLGDGPRLGEPRRAPGDPLWVDVLQACAFSLRIAAAGWLIGVTVGLLLALLMQRLRLAEAAILPWVVLSQTVPLIAIAPLVRRWGSGIEIGSFTWENEYSVAVIAATSPFPVAVGMPRRLKCPRPRNSTDAQPARLVGPLVGRLTAIVPTAASPRIAAASR